MILVGVFPANPAAVSRVRLMLDSAPHIAVAAMPPEALATAGPAVSVLVLMDQIAPSERAAVLAAYAGRLRPPGLLLVRPPTAPQDDLPALLKLAGVGLVEEDAPAAEAVAAVEALSRGGFYLSALYQFRWKDCILSAVTARILPPASPLTAREQDVLAVLAEGKSNAEIARTLFIGLNTVDTHLMSIFRKLGVHNRTEAVAMVLRGGIGLAARPLAADGDRPTARAPLGAGGAGRRRAALAGQSRIHPATTRTEPGPGLDGIPQPEPATAGPVGPARRGRPDLRPGLPTRFEASTGDRDERTAL